MHAKTASKSLAPQSSAEGCRPELKIIVEHAWGGAMLLINFQFDPTPLNRALGCGDLGWIGTDFDGRVQGRI